MPSKDASKDGDGFSVLSRRIKHAREHRAWTQADVANRIGSTRLNISRWENGITIPGFYFRQKLAELFEMDVAELGSSAASKEEETPRHELSPNQVSISTSTPWIMPHRRNLFFTGRKEILTTLHSGFRSHHNTGSIFALSGLGGGGKTQIAIEYAYIFRESYEAIFWLNASTQDSLSTDLMTLAAFLNITRQPNDEEFIMRSVKQWLGSHTGWLLILDNVTSLEEVIFSFIPTDNPGDVLLTTHIQVSGSIAQRIVVDNLTRDENITFLLYRTKILAPGTLLAQATQENQLQAAEIVDELEGFPLALDQAGAYIEETQCGLSHYLHLLKTHRQELLKRRGKSSLNHPDPVTTTWQISFQQIKDKWPASAELLHLCAFLNSESIPEELLTLGAPKLGPILSKTLGNPLQLDTILEPLHLYSLIRRFPETRSLTIHRLVQDVLRQDISPAQQKQWARRILLALNHAFPEVKQENWEQCQRFLPHVQICVQFSTEFALFLPEAAELFRRAGDFALTRRMFTRSEIFFQQALAIHQHLSTIDTPEIARGLYNLGELYRIWGRYPDAESLLKRAQAIYKQSPPPDQFDATRTLNSLGELYHNLGRYPEAEALFQEAFSLTERIGGPNHNETFTTLHHLTRLYHSQGRYAEAEQNYLKILYAFEQRFGARHVEVAVILSNLAINYRKQGNLEKAEALLQRTLNIEEQAFGPDDHRFATTLHNLGVIYQKQGQLDQALGVFQRALAIKEASLGPKHLSSITTATNLANLLRMQKQYPPAKALLRQALASDLGEEHPYTAVILRNLARLLSEEGNNEEAQALSLRALAIKTKQSPHSSP